MTTYGELSRLMLSIKKTHISSFFKKVTLILILGSSLKLVYAQGKKAPLSFKKDIFPLLDTYCIDCHDEENEEGDLNLELYLKAVDPEQEPALWEKISKMITLEQMPPSERKKQLSEGQKEKIHQWVSALSTKWAEGKMGQDPGLTSIHRLNNFEYNYTIRDLFGLKLWLVGNFPEDGSGQSGFSNNADALYLPTLLAENYFETAEKIIEKIYSEPKLLSRYLISQPSYRKKPDEAAKDVIKYWATFIYRRKPESTEIDKLVEIFTTEFQDKNNYYDAMKMPLFTMLISPKFLYRSSLTKEKSGVYPIDDFELASRLSYFLWSSMPDKELFKLAQQGNLSKEAILVKQVKRMLNDPKSTSLGKHLGGQWFGWEDLRSAAEPDPDQFPQFTFPIRVALYQESTLFFNHLVTSNGSIYDFIDSDYTFLNNTLARYYHLPPIPGNEFKKVPINDPNRGGILGMGSVLTSTSLALRSSPSIRGAYVIKDILGIPLPEPPMNIEPLAEDPKDLQNLSVKESLEAHQSNPDCRNCHQEIDPIGLTLETLDGIGRVKRLPKTNDLVVGKLPDGSTFSTPAELKLALMNNKELFAKNTAQKFLTYALGRELTPYDRPTVKKISDEIIKNNGSIHTAIIEVVKSYPFKNKRAHTFQP